MKPSNFSWVIPKKLAGSRGPRPRDLPLLQALGVRKVIRLSTEKEREESGHADTALFLPHGLESWDRAIRDFRIPGCAQAFAIVDEIAKSLAANRAVVVTCGAGQGRTGMMLRAYLASVYGLAGADERLLAAGRVGHEKPCQRQFVDNLASERGWLP